MDSLTKIITQEELDKERVPRNNAECKCPMKDCYQIGNYSTCYLHTCCMCYIYNAKYRELNHDQRMRL